MFPSVAGSTLTCSEMETGRWGKAGVQHAIIGSATVFLPDPAQNHFTPLIHLLTWEFTTPDLSEVKVAQSCPTLCDPMDYTVHGILQARILEWVAFPLSRGSSNPGIEPRSLTLRADSVPAEPQGKPKSTGVGSLSLLQQIFLTQESKPQQFWDFPGGLVVETPVSNAGGVGLIPGQRTEIPLAVLWPKKIKEREKNMKMYELKNKSHSSLFTVFQIIL